MGAVLVANRVAAPLFDAGRTLLHGITLGGHPVSAAVALENLDSFGRDGILEHARTQEPHVARRLGELLELPVVGDVRGCGFFWAIELVKDDRATRLDSDVREALLRGYLPDRLLEAGLIACADDRGDAVLQMAPPLISDRDVLDDAGVFVASRGGVAHA
jgi:adenosylmethionine-8-amino-7-oxononanoate aminotransferase